jgi:hypothetical protein
MTSRTSPAAWWLSELPGSALALSAWSPPGQLAIDGTHPSHDAIERHLEGWVDGSSGTLGATSGSALGASGSASGAPALGLLFALALVAAGCWSRLVLLLRRYCACVFLSPLERPG